MTIANNVAPTGAPTQTASNLVPHIQIRHTPRFGSKYPECIFIDNSSHQSVTDAMQPPRETKAPQTTQLQSATQRSVAQAPYLLKGASAASTGNTAVSNRTVWATPPAASLPVSANVAPAPSFNVPPVAGQQPTHRGVAVPVQSLPPSTCSLPSCSRPAHVNSDGSVSGYCTMNHREYVLVVPLMSLRVLNENAFNLIGKPSPVGPFRAALCVGSIRRVPPTTSAAQLAGSKR